MRLSFPERKIESTGTRRASLAAAIAFSFLALGANASTINFHGRIIRPNGSPVQDINVEFRIQIRSPGSENCLLTEETVFAPVVNGLFSLPIGSNTRSDSYVGQWSFDQALSNRTSFTALNAGDCALPGGYTALPGDGRRISVLFKETSMTSFETMPTQALNYAPMAIEAKYVSGYGSGSLLKIEGVDNRTTLSGAQLTELVALTNGNYVRSSGATGAVVPVLSGNASGAVAGSIWYDSSAGQLKFSDGTTAQVVGSASGGAGGISSINGLTALTQTFATIGTSGSSPNWSSSGSAHTLNIPLAASSGVSAGLISTAQYDSFNAKLGSTLNSGQIFVGSTGNVATAVTPSGDISISSSGATTLTAIRGQAVDATVPVEGQVFRWTTSTKWTPAFLSMADVRSTAIPGNTIFPTTSCTTGQTLNWSSLTDTFVCNSIAITGAQVSYGSALTAATVFAAPAGSTGAPSFRALVASDLPAGVSSQWTTSGANIFYGTGNVGIGTTAPSAKLEVAGNSRLIYGTGEKLIFGDSTGNIPGTLQYLFGAAYSGQNLSSSGGAFGFINPFNGGSLVRQSGGRIDMIVAPAGASATLNYAMSIMPTGDVLVPGKIGLGNTAPTRLFDVAGPIRVAPTVLPSSPAAGDLAFDSNASNALKYHNGTSWVSIGSGTGDFLANGSVPMTGQFQSIAGSAVAPGMSFVGDTDNGIYAPAADNVAISTAGTEKLRILANGSVGIGTTNPQAKLHVNGTLRVDTLNAATATHVCIDGSNVLSACSSSIRYKENVFDLNRSLETILSLRPVTYDWIQSKEHEVGFIAEEVEKIDSRLVTYNKQGQIQGVKYEQIVAPIVKAFQELYQSILGTQADVAVLKAENARLKAADEAKTRDLEAKDRRIANVEANAAIAKAKADKAEKENAEMKARLDKIEKMLKAK